MRSKMLDAGVAPNYKGLWPGYLCCELNYHSGRELHPASSIAQ